MPPLFFLPMGIKDNGLAGCGNPRSGTLIPNSHKVGLPITIVPSSACLGLEWGFSRSVQYDDFHLFFWLSLSYLPGLTSGLVRLLTGRALAK